MICPDSLMDTQICECPKCRAANPPLAQAPGSGVIECRPQTIGELRAFLAPFSDDCPLMPLNYGAFRYVLDAQGNGKIQYV